MRPRTFTPEQRARRNAWLAEYRAKPENIQKRKEWLKEYNSRPEVKQRKKEWAEARKPKDRTRLNELYRRDRKIAIETYGGKCACCGESRIEFLAIDHINGGGYEHRKQGIGPISRWLKANNYPPGFRVLCHNCNQSIGAFGYCPHHNLDSHAQA